MVAIQVKAEDGIVGARSNMNKDGKRVRQTCVGDSEYIGQAGVGSLKEDLGKGGDSD